MCLQGTRVNLVTMPGVAAKTFSVLRTLVVPNSSKWSFESFLGQFNSILTFSHANEYDEDGFGNKTIAKGNGLSLNGFSRRFVGVDLSTGA